MAVTLPEDIELYRDHMWRRTPEVRVEHRGDAERLFEELGFCSALVDSRQPGPSLYIAVCGRRDAHMPRNVQKDPETSLTWTLKDDVLRAGRIYYAKLIRGKSTFVAPRLISHFNALWGLPRAKEKERLSADAQAVLKVLRKEWEMGTADLRKASAVTERARFTRAIDELQKKMKVVPGDVLYEPFTYIWTLAEGRFPEQLGARVTRAESLREVARAFLNGAGMTLLGELSRVTGLSRPDAGAGNHALVDEGYAVRVAQGIYCLTNLEARLELIRSSF
jgi:hypothetical protein